MESLKSLKENVAIFLPENGLEEKLKLAEKENDKVIFGGRLGQYKYYNMDQVISAALESVKGEFEK